MFVHVIGAHLATLLLQATPPNPGTLNPDQSQQIALEAIRRGTSTGLLVPLAFFAMVVLLAWLGIRKKQAAMQARTDLQKHLLDKFNSGQEFGAFLESAGGKRFLEELSAQNVGPWGGLRGGIILTTLGIGMLFLSFTNANKGLFTPAVLLLAVGAGLLISAAISHRLAKRRDQDPKLEGRSAVGS